MSGRLREVEVGCGTGQATRSLAARQTGNSGRLPASRERGDGMSRRLTGNSVRARTSDASGETA